MNKERKEIDNIIRKFLKDRNISMIDGFHGTFGVLVNVLDFLEKKNYTEEVFDELIKACPTAHFILKDLILLHDQILEASLNFSEPGSIGNA